MAIFLKEILADSRDGEWGESDPGDDTVEMAVIRGTDFERVCIGNIDSLPRRHVPRRIAERKRLQPGDIVIETAGGSKDRPTGRTLLLRHSVLQRISLPVTCASFARFLRIDQSKAEPAYVFWLLQHLYDCGVLRKYHTQHTGVARFQYTTFAESEPLDIPQRGVQRRVADILSAYNDLIENNTKRIKILEEMARSLYREWFVNFRFPGHEKVKLGASSVGKVPEGWNRVQIKDIAEMVDYGYTASAQRDPVGPRFLRITDIVPGSIDWDTVPYCEIDKSSLEKYELCEGDIVVARTGATTGYAKRLNKHHPRSVFASYLVRVRMPNSALSQYVGTLMESDEYKGFIKRNLGGAAQPQANARVLTSAELWLPPHHILKRFAGIAEPLRDEIEMLQAKARVLRRQRDLLLPRLISGEIDLSRLAAPRA